MNFCFLKLSDWELKVSSCSTPEYSLPVPIYVICDYYIHKTDLADLFSLEKMEIFTANFEISFTFRIREFTT